MDNDQNNSPVETNDSENSPRQPDTNIPTSNQLPFMSDFSLPTNFNKNQALLNSQRVPQFLTNTQSLEHIFLGGSTLLAEKDQLKDDSTELKSEENFKLFNVSPSGKLVFCGGSTFLDKTQKVKLDSLEEQKPILTDVDYREEIEEDKDDEYDQNELLVHSVRCKVWKLIKTTNTYKECGPAMFILSDVTDQNRSRIVIRSLINGELLVNSMIWNELKVWPNDTKKMTLSAFSSDGELVFYFVVVDQGTVSSLEYDINVRISDAPSVTFNPPNEADEEDPDDEPEQVTSYSDAISDSDVQEVISISSGSKIEVESTAEVEDRTEVSCPEEENESSAEEISIENESVDIVSTDTSAEEINEDSSQDLSIGTLYSSENYPSDILDENINDVPLSDNEVVENTTNDLMDFDSMDTESNDNGNIINEFDETKVDGINMTNQLVETNDDGVNITNELVETNVDGVNMTNECSDTDLIMSINNDDLEVNMANEFSETTDSDLIMSINNDDFEPTIDIPMDDDGVNITNELVDEFSETTDSDLIMSINDDDLEPTIDVPMDDDIDTTVCMNMESTDMADEPVKTEESERVVSFDNYTHDNVDKRIADRDNHVQGSGYVVDSIEIGECIFNMEGTVSELSLHSKKYGAELRVVCRLIDAGLSSRLMIYDLNNPGCILIDHVISDSTIIRCSLNKVILTATKTDGTIGMFQISMPNRDASNKLHSEIVQRMCLSSKHSVSEYDYSSNSKRKVPDVQ